MLAPEARLEPGGRLTAVRRSRVLERIARASAYPVTVIAAPAGYGKTVALRHFLETVSDPVVRYDLRSSEASLLGFIRGFARAFAGVAPDLSKTVLSAYESSQTSPTCADDLAQWIHAHIAEYRGLIAVDDLHIAQSDRRVDDLLNRLVDLTKERVRWIFASRGAGNLPIASWMAYGDLEAVIDESDLRMTLDEARAFAAELAPDVTLRDLEQLLVETGAWPTAMNFAMRGFEHLGDFGKASARGKDLLYAYLAEQVYASLTSEAQRLLHFGALLPDFDIKVLSYAGFEQPEAVLRGLHARIGFVWPVANGVYRCHDLFRDFLNHQLDVQGARTRDSLYFCAARALESSSDFSAALSIYSKIPAMDDILRLLRRHCFEILADAHSDTVGEAISVFDAETLSLEPILIGLSGLREIEAGNETRGEALLAKAMSSSEDRELAAEFALRLGRSLFHQRRDLTVFLEPLVHDGNVTMNRRMHALSLLAAYYVFMGRTGEALAALDELMRFAPTCSIPSLAARIYHRAGIVSLEAGQAQTTSRRLFEKAVDISLRHGLYETACAAYGGLMTVSRYHCDDMEYCEQMARRAMETAVRSGDLYSRQSSVMQATELAYWKGDLRLLEDLLKRALEATGTKSGLRVFLRGHIAALYCAKGDYRSAYDEFVVADFSRFFDFDRWFNLAFLSVCALGSGRIHDAQIYAARSLESIAVSETSVTLARVSADLTVSYCAIIAALNGKPDHAKRNIGKPFAPDDRRAQSIRQYAAVVCDRIAGRASDKDLDESLLRVRRAGVAGIALIIDPLVRRTLSNIQPAATLTKAECDVLEKFSEGYSSKEIAAKTGRSVHTVRTLGQRAISKLGCSGRQQAIAAAQQRGLIGPGNVRPSDTGVSRLPQEDVGQSYGKA